MLCSVISNIAIKAWSKRGQKLTRPIDFMIDWGGDLRAKEQSVEEMKQLLLGIASTQNKKFDKQRRTTPPRKKR